MIPCTKKCIYQEDGVCNMESCGGTSAGGGGKCGYQVSLSRI